MARKHFDNVRHLITTTGVGGITFGTVPATWRSFAAAGAVAGDQPGYTIQDGDGIELGYLTLGADALTATRTVIYSSNSNNPLDLSGSAILECTPLASMINDDLVSFVRAQSASSGEKAQARSNLGMTTTGQALATAMNAADARDTIGATTVGSALLTASNAAAARTAAGATTVGSSLFTAADAAAARAAVAAGAACFAAHKNGAAQVVSSGADPKVTFGTKLYDIGNRYDATNSRWTPPAGPVTLMANLTWTTGVLLNDRFVVRLLKNGATYRVGPVPGAYVAGYMSGEGVFHDYANGTDYYEMSTGHGSGSALTISGDPTTTYFSGFAG
ncbi:hypothetical protein [Rhodopseudomonas sp.]|uniref:hypothetical protein n=1 Tax=Rhodopseudomonas sp. TaxID=1078 RepID=UPI003B3BA0CC